MATVQAATWTRNLCTLCQMHDVDVGTEASCTGTMYMQSSGCDSPGWNPCPALMHLDTISQIDLPKPAVCASGFVCMEHRTKQNSSLSLHTHNNSDGHGTCTACICMACITPMLHCMWQL